MKQTTCTPVFTEEQLMNYAKTRLSGQNVSLEEIEKIRLHNGTMPNQLEALLAAAVEDYEKVIQENGREPLFYVSKLKTLHIPQWSGTRRSERYQDMIRAIAPQLGIDFKSLVCERSKRKTVINYSNFAYDFIKGFILSRKGEIPNTVIFGP